jgi:hypothetical protein
MAQQHNKALPRLFFDIETTAREDVEDWVQDVKVDKRLKDQETAKANAIAEAIERAPLDSDLATIRLISMQVGLSGVPTIILVPQKKLTKKAQAALSENKILSSGLGGSLIVCDEMTAIEKFWQSLGLCSGCSVGFNTLGFDLPFILKRSMELCVQPGMFPQMAKYRTEPTTDLAGILSNWDYTKSKRLKWLAKRYGLEVLAEEKDGSMVADMTDEELITYGLSDLWVTVQLYNLMNGVYFNHYQDGG